MLESKSGAANIKVIGIGGAGCNIVARMIRDEILGVEYIAMDTDADNLKITEAPVRIALGKKLTSYLDAGIGPDIGQWVPEEIRDEIKQTIAGADIVFLVAGLGGGTGAGAMPVVADIAKQSGALTIAIVTKPYSFEGRIRGELAGEGVKQLITSVNTLILLENDRMLELDEGPVEPAFAKPDRFLSKAIQAIIETGLGNGDFTSIKTILKDMGLSIMSSGYGSGQDRAETAAKSALDGNQFGKYSLNIFKRAILSISGNSKLALSEVEDAARIVKKALHPDATITYSAFVDPKSNDEICVTIICGGGLKLEEPPVEKQQYSTLYDTKCEKAMALFSEAIESGDDSAYTLRGWGYQENGEIDKAIADFSMFINKYPDKPSGYWDRGEAFILSKEYDKAVADFNKAIEIDLNNDAGYRNRGLAYLDMGEFDKAISDLDKAMELKPSYENISARSSAYYLQGDYNETILWCTKLIQMGSTNSKGYCSRGFAYAAQNQYEKAIADYSMAIKLGDQFIYLRRAIAYAILGQKQKAVADYTEFLKISDGSEPFVEAKQDLDTLLLEIYDGR